MTRILNAVRIPLANIDRYSPEQFRRVIAQICRQRGRVVSLFAAPDERDLIEYAEKRFH